MQTLICRIKKTPGFLNYHLEGAPGRHPVIRVSVQGGFVTVHNTASQYDVYRGADMKEAEAMAKAAVIDIARCLHGACDPRSLWVQFRQGSSSTKEYVPHWFKYIEENIG